MKDIILKGMKHFRIVCTHKYYVFKYCRIAGITWQGIVHDLSKFTPTEFIESVKYYQGTRSPIDACKEKNGVSFAWMHHKGRNQHHYEYWQDNFDRGGNPVKMPYKYVVELVCDYLGAGEAYMKDKFSFQGEYLWWQNKKKNHIAMHSHTLMFVEVILKELAETEDVKKCLNKKHTKKLYKYLDKII